MALIGSRVILRPQQAHFLFWVRRAMIPVCPGHLNHGSILRGLLLGPISFLSLNKYNWSVSSEASQTPVRRFCAYATRAAAKVLTGLSLEKLKPPRRKDCPDS